MGSGGPQIVLRSPFQKLNTEDEVWPLLFWEKRTVGRKVYTVKSYILDIK